MITHPINAIANPSNEPPEVTLTEPRWSVILVLSLVALLLILLPGRVRVAPIWLACIFWIAVIVPMIGLSLATAKIQWLRIERVSALLFFLISGFALMDQLGVLVSLMLRRSTEISATQLLSSSIAVWAGTVLLFSFAYWRTDRGGPEARANRSTSVKPDWLFPQETMPDDVPANWHPKFLDYLFLSYCAATAFSPSGPQPLTSRAMLLLMLESMISLITIVAIAARAIALLSGLRACESFC